MSSASVIETFPNPRPGRDFEIAIDCPEFTSICPKTGLPDFGAIEIRYVPGALCAEMKSLKLYATAFRNVGIFQENVVNRLLDDFVRYVKPRTVTVIGTFRARGGIATTVRASRP
jgi:7-cyano-7-deazaguanine reductase